MNRLTTALRPADDFGARTIEPHFSPNFFAEAWGISPDTVRRWFQDDPRVLKLQNGSTRKRTRAELRIPLSVAQEEYRKRTKGE